MDNDLLDTLDLVKRLKVGDRIIAIPTGSKEYWKQDCFKYPVTIIDIDLKPNGKYPDAYIRIKELPETIIHVGRYYIWRLKLVTTRNNISYKPKNQPDDV